MDITSLLNPPKHPTNDSIESGGGEPHLGQGSPSSQRASRVRSRVRSYDDELDAETASALKLAREKESQGAESRSYSHPTLPVNEQGGNHKRSHSRSSILSSTSVSALQPPTTLTSDPQSTSISFPVSSASASLARSSSQPEQGFSRRQEFRSAGRPWSSINSAPRPLTASGLPSAGSSSRNVFGSPPSRQSLNTRSHIPSPSRRHHLHSPTESVQYYTDATAGGEGVRSSTYPRHNRSHSMQTAINTSNSDFPVSSPTVRRVSLTGLINVPSHGNSRSFTESYHAEPYSPESIHRGSGRKSRLFDSDEMSPTPVSPTSSDSAEEQYRSDVGRLKPDGGRLGHRSPGFEDRGEGSNVMRIDSLLGNTRDSGPGLGDPPRSFPVDQPSTLDVLPGEDAGPRCSYTDSCTTGSPLRKVVSHIFGRNKLCTRQIPKGVWVHYCRKHYQRSRYRNPKGFALLQCDLVRKQVDRLQLWGGVKDWIVKVRKREEMRLNKENAQLAAGRDAVGGISAEPDDLGDQGDGGMTDQPATAAGSSRWLVSSTGPGKSARQVLDILDRIEHEIAATGSPFPDVEILPNVVTEKTRQPSRLEGPRGAMTLDASLSEEMFDSVGRSYGSTHDRAEGIDPQRKRKASSGSSQHGASVVDQHSLEQPDPKRRSRTLQRGLNVEPRRGGAAGFQQSRRDLGLEDESDAGLELGSPQHRRLPSLAMEGAEASRVHSLQNRMAELETGALGETPMHDGTSRRLGRERSHSPPSYEGQNYPASRQEHAEAGQPSTRRNPNPPYSSDPRRFHPLR